MTPERTFFWTGTGWRPAVPGEPGDLVWNGTSWEPGAIGGNFKWNGTTWLPGPGGTHIWNGTTWLPNEDEGYGGSHYWNGTVWLPNRGISFGALAVTGLQALYDPSDLTSIYESRTGGSTGAVDSVVGIMLDKSEMGGKTAAAFIAGQTELVTNGGFDADASWTRGAGWAISDGSAALTTNTGLLTQAGILTSGAWYVATVNVASETGDLRIRLGSSGAIGLAVGLNTIVAQASGTDLSFVPSGSTSAVIDNVSVKALPGYHALAPSDAARPILRSASSKNYLDTDGTDDWMQIFPTLNLGEQWWHVGGWSNEKGTGGARNFATSSGLQGAPTSDGSRYLWRNSADTAYNNLTGAGNSSPHVMTVRQTTTGAMQGGINGVDATAIVPYDDSGLTQGLALFSTENDTYNNGLDGRFYGGAFGTGTLSTSDRALLERYVAGLTGVTL